MLHKSVSGLLQRLRLNLSRAAIAKARRKIQASLNALKRVRTAEGASRAIERGWPTSVNRFLEWKRLGASTLYEANSDLLEDVREETARLAALAKPIWSRAKRPKRTDELTRIKKELAECKALLAARDVDILQMSKEIETERRDKRFYMRRLEEVQRG